MASSDLPLSQPNPPNTSDTVLLRRPWLTAIRLIWIVVAVVGVSLYIASIPYRFNALNPDCQSQTCSSQDQLQVSEIQRVGLSGTFVAWYFIVVDTFITVVYGVTGALIFWRRSDSLIALFVAFTLLANGLTFGPEIYFLVEANPALLPVLVLLLIAGYGFLIVFTFIFPDGQFVPRWTRWLALVFLAGQAFMLVRESSVAYYGRSLVYVGYLLAGGAIGVGAQIYRYRRVSTPAQRQQTKWVMLGAAGLLILTFIGIFPAFFNPALLQFDLPYRMMRVPLFAALPAIMLPIAIMFSILRYRLWDIDFVINRSLVYGALTTLLLALFGGSLLIINGLFQNFAGGPLVALTLSAAVFGALFQPARRRLQRFVDRRFYHIYIDYQKTPLPVLPLGDMTQILRQTHFGAYKNLELIGRGGMAEVYKSTHPTLNTPVAIKILPTTLAAQADFRQRFTREAQVVAKLEHPNIVRVFDYGQQADMQYMVMEYIDGQDLAAFLQDHGKLSLAPTLPLIRQIADALDYAHAQGLVHRDIKPSNILLDATSQTRVVLTDFGIAKILDARTAMTGTGGVLGTFDYIAPEQIEASTKVDGRADVYAFGVMVYQMLTGELPFKHNNPGALLIAHMTQPPPDPRQIAPDLSGDVAHAIQRAMAKNPTERFAMAREFVAELS